MASECVVRPAEMLVLKCKLPVAWKPRMWVAAHLMNIAGYIAGISTEIELSDKK